VNFKKAAVRSVVIIAIAAVSILIGFLYQNISEKADMKKYPLEYTDFVTKYSSEYGVPEYIIYSVIKVESDFDSSLLSEDGEIGLMQVKPEHLKVYSGSLRDNYDTGMLYDPETNIKYGTYQLSKMYLRLGTWRSVFAAMYAGEETVTAWLSDEAVSDIEENVKPKLREIPDKGCRKFTEKLEDISETYKNLYYTK